jgi:hypothetical protein
MLIGALSVCSVRWYSGTLFVNSRTSSRSTPRFCTCWNDERSSYSCHRRGDIDERKKNAEGVGELHVCLVWGVTLFVAALPLIYTLEQNELSGSRCGFWIFSRAAVTIDHSTSYRQTDLCHPIAVLSNIFVNQAAVTLRRAIYLSIDHSYHSDATQASFWSLVLMVVMT